MKYCLNLGWASPFFPMEMQWSMAWRTCHGWADTLCGEGNWTALFQCLRGSFYF